MENDLISHVELRRQLAIWCEKLCSAGECGGCEVELLQTVIKMVDAQAAVDAEPVRHGKWFFDEYDYSKLYKNKLDKLDKLIKKYEDLIQQNTNDNQK